MTGFRGYIGPRPYARHEAHCFSGREDEARSLVALLRIHPVVLLYGESGAGKTSLVNAGLQALIEQEGADVLPCVRLAPLTPGDHSFGINPLLWRMLGAWCSTLDETARWAQHGIAAFLASRPRPAGFGVLPALRVIILDEGTGLPHGLPPQHAAQVAEQLHAAMMNDPLLRILTVVDSPAGEGPSIGKALDPNGKALLALGPLSRAGALASVHRLAGSAGLEITAEAASKLVGDLVTTRLRSTRTGVERIGEQLDPLQLQLAWRAAILALRPDDAVIRMEHVARVSEEAVCLDAYCREVVQHAAEAAGLSAQDLMRWIANEFVDGEGVRVAVPAEEGSIRGLPRAAAEALAAEGLLNKETLAGTEWFELGHDCLAPIVRTLAGVPLRSGQAAPQPQAPTAPPPEAATPPAPEADALSAPAAQSQPIPGQAAPQAQAPTAPPPEAAAPPTPEADALSAPAAQSQPVPGQAAPQPQAPTAPPPEAAARTRPVRVVFLLLMVLIVVAASALLVFSRMGFSRWIGRSQSGPGAQLPSLPTAGRQSSRNEAAAMADALLNQAMASARTGNVKEGLQQAKQALGIYEHARDVAGRSQALTVVGILYGASSKLGDSAYCFGEAARLRLTLKEDAGAAALLGLQGDAELAAGDAAAAASSYRKAFQLIRSGGKPSEQADLLISLARAYAARRWWAGALDVLRQARILARQAQDASLEAQVLEQEANVYEASGAPVTARGLRASASALRNSAVRGAAIPMGAGAVLAPK